MKTAIDAVLLDECRRYHLRFACDDCVHFRTEDAQCGHGYPPGPRRDELSPGRDNATLAFCKEFELA